MRFIVQDDFKLCLLLIASAVLSLGSTAWGHSPTSALEPRPPSEGLSFELCIADRDGRCFHFSEGRIREVLRGQNFVQRELDEKSANKLLTRIEADLKKLPDGGKAPCSSTIRYLRSGQEQKRVCRELLSRSQVKTWKALLKELEASTLK